MSGTPVADWFVNLPLSDPRCDNESCIAFQAGYNTSQAEISYTSQFTYGQYVTWVYLSVIVLVAISALAHHIADRKPRLVFFYRPSTWDGVVSIVRSVTYRRLEGRWGNYLGLPSFGTILLVVFAGIATSILVFSERPYYRVKRDYGSSPLGVRAGMMATAFVPLIVALAGKMNLITILTGIGHEKLNALHRWLSWIMMGLSLVHIITFIWQPLHEGGAASLRWHYYWDPGMGYTGTPTFALLFFLFLGSLPVLKRLNYELFKRLHTLGFITFMVLMFWHAADKLDSWHYLYATVAVWAVSVLGRIVFKNSSVVRDSFLKACPTICRQYTADMLKLEVSVPNYWTSRPGQHVFLRFPRLNMMDHHPFSIAAVTHTRERRDSLTNVEKVTAKVPKVLTFLIRPHRGFTKRLHDRLKSEADSSELTLSTIVDGPYGTHIGTLENHFDTVILVAGGGGITAMLPWLLHLTQCMHSSSACTTKQVRLIWMIRKIGNIDWVHHELRTVHELEQEGNVTVDIYITGEQNPTPIIPTGPLSMPGLSFPEFTPNASPVLPSPTTPRFPPTALPRFPSSSGSPGSSPIQSRRGSVYFPPTTSPITRAKIEQKQADRKSTVIASMHFGGRIQFRNVIPKLIGNGRTAVLGCGPERLKIDLSNVVAKSQRLVRRGEAKEIMLHTETFDW